MTPALHHTHPVMRIRNGCVLHHASSWLPIEEPAPRLSDGRISPWAARAKPDGLGAMAIRLAETVVGEAGHGHVSPRRQMLEAAGQIVGQRVPHPDLGGRLALPADHA